MYNDEYLRGLLGASLFPFRGLWPRLEADIFIAPGARIIGDVEMGKGCGVWYNAVIRADVHYVRIGSKSNVQDNCTLHVTHDTHPLIIGSGVTIGHNAVLHGCTIGDNVLIGMHATILDGAIIGEGSMVAAGALVSPGMVVPPGTLALGVPARVVRELRPGEVEHIVSSAIRYVGYAAENREGVRQARGQ